MGRTLERPEPRDTELCGGGGGVEPRAETKVLSTLPLGKEDFHPWEPCPWEQQPSRTERSVSWPENGSCSLNGKPGPHQSLWAAPHCSHDNGQWGHGQPGDQRGPSGLQAFPLEQGGHLPLQAVPLVQSTQGCIWVLVMEVDGGSHQQEGGVRHVHAPAHLPVQLDNDRVPAR